ncbi:5794_t:CDS:2, partial [Entrophospora sp. SA101]
CYDDHVKHLEGACADLQFNVILSSYHTMKQQGNNMEKYFAKIYEKFEDTDVRGANKRVAKKMLRKTVEVACKTILNYPKDDDDTSESKKFQAKLAILNAIQFLKMPNNRKRHIDYKDNISPNINDGKPKKRCIDDKDDNITTMDTIKNCYDDHVKNLEGACADLQFNVILSNDVKLSHRKDTDVRGANKRVVKKILRKTVEVACKTILHYPKDDGTSESKKFQAKLAILNAIQYLYNTHYIDWVTKLKISYDVIRGLFFMHNGEILHHDVKCENILIDEDGNAKVSNFELSRNLSGETSRISNLNDYIPWLAPEKIESGTQLYNLDCEMFR